jgi:hypothetical protein
MKYLKKYKVFELREETEEVDRILSILNDMCLDIRDLDLKAYILYNSSDLTHTDITLKIFKEIDSDNRFSLKLINSEIFQIVDFLKSEGWKVKRSLVSNAGSVYESKIENGKIICLYNDKELLWEIEKFTIEFKKII